MDTSIINKSLDLEKLAAEKASDYQSARPFAHIVIDNFFDPVILDDILETFPDENAISWNRMRDLHSVKLATRNESQIPLKIRNFLYQLNSSTFVRFVEALTGISNLIPDPHFDGGGLHQILPGGKLNVHVDFNKHLTLGLDRRLNLLVYLNKNWKEEYGGHFELWNADITRCEKKVAPLFNRLVIFSTTEFSYHGHPNPLTCPAGMSRKSLALYYYSNGRPEHEKARNHSTIFKLQPQESRAKAAVKMFMPPIAYSLLDKVKRR